MYESHKALLQLKTTFWVLNPRNNCHDIFEGKNNNFFPKENIDENKA